MSWLASFFIAFLTAASGAVAAGYVANLSVDWYQISSREGASGYYVVAMGLLGIIVGGIIGLVVSRAIAGGPHPSSFRAVGISLGTMLGLVGVIGGAARLLADVPPEIDGETLLLDVEVRWPAEQSASPATLPGDGFVYLHSVPRFSHTVRASSRGPLWKEDAHRVDGRWVVPGAVELFTERGTRMLQVEVSPDSSFGFQVPLPARPGRQDMTWSDWLPRYGSQAPPPARQYTYRFRVHRWSEPARTQRVGRFEVQTIASSFYDATINGKTVLAAVADFALRFDGKPLVIEGPTAPAGGATARFERVGWVSVLPGSDPALLVQATGSTTPGVCYLLVPEGDRVRTDFVAGCENGIASHVLTGDSSRFREAERREVPRGTIDRTGFAIGGLYLVGDAVIDSRRFSVRRFSGDSEFTLVPAVPPLALSPDQRSFARYGYAGYSAEKPVLSVIDFVADRHYLLPIDPARMRYPKLSALDPAWLDHHFTWVRGSNGVDRLIEREGFVPLPYQGELSVEAGDYRSYRLEHAGEALRAALMEFLVKEFKAEALPADSGAYQKPMRIDGKQVIVACSGEFGYVLVENDRTSGNTDTTLVAAIAKRFDAELATGKYDGLFERKGD